MAEDVYRGLEPPELWRHFAALNRIPRCSRSEAAARAYVQQEADAAGVAWTVDERGNTVVYVPATPGREAAAPVAIQAHLDMVCEKRPEVAHDFSRDPIRPRIEGDCVYASGTTLGADNGIGAAAALACLTTPGLRHGPLDLVFTVEEEVGLFGAASLRPETVRARLLINLDSEDPRELTIGCAGGGGAILRLPVRTEPVPEGWTGCEVVVSGLKGGHSGVQIHEPLANAIKVLERVLRSIRDAGIDLRLVSVQGGNAHNAIPRDASASLAIPGEVIPTLNAAVDAVEEQLRAEWRAHEPGLSLRLRELPTPEQAFNRALGNEVLELLRNLPHGVLRMSDVFPGKVETSSNLAQVQTEGERITICTSSRSFVTAELERVQAEIRFLGEAVGAEVEIRDGYPGWEPDPDSPLLRVAESVYTRVIGTPPEVQVIHAGLECGVIAAALPGLDAVSFGPRIEGAHTPEERVYISTVESTWRVLTGLLDALSAPERAE